MRLSVITINYNNRDGLRKTIESVVNQTWRDFEFIIIDGGSTDGSVEVIKEYSDSISYWVSESDSGVYHAMNKGIDVATGHYCNFMNSGDCFYNNKTLESIVDELGNESIVYGNFMFSNGASYNISNILSFDYFYRKCRIHHQSSFIDTCLLKKYHYDEKYKISSDYKFWIQTIILDNCTYKFVDKIISLADNTGISMSNKALRMQEDEQCLKELIPARILLDYQNLYVGWENNWEKKLYNEITESKYHRYLYTMNVVFIRFVSFFKKGACWIKKYPLSIDK